MCQSYDDINVQASLCCKWCQLPTRPGYHVLPGGCTYVPVLASSRQFYWGVRWGFTAFVIALGSSYFQRLAQVGQLLDRTFQIHMSNTCVQHVNCLAQLSAIPFGFTRAECCKQFYGWLANSTSKASTSAGHSHL